ncbi:MAG TPA: hypothetical protein VKU83_01405, partial [Puia sp.]|nr:hypothetical protein [Puia sp.]
KGNNYLFVVFSSSGAAGTGAAWFVSHPPVDLKSLNYVLDLDNLGDLNDTTHRLDVGGYHSAAAWASVWPNVREKRYLSFSFDSSSAGDQALFSGQHIPCLGFSTGSGKPESHAEKINVPGELQTVKFIYGLIQAANTRGRLAPAP